MNLVINMWKSNFKTESTVHKRIYKVDFIKTKSVYSINNIVKWIKEKHRLEDNICKSRLIAFMHKELSKLNNKKTTTIFQWAKDLNMLPKKIYRSQIAQEKNAHYHE